MKNRRIQTSLVLALSVLLFAVVFGVMKPGGVARDDFHVVEGPDGSLYFYSYQGEKPPVIVRRHPDGSESILAQDDIDWHIEPELSPDGKTLLYAVGPSMASLGLKTINLETGRWRDLLSAPGTSYSAPTFFDDGERIAYNELTNSEGTSKIWVADLDGANARELLTGVTGRQGQPDVSPNGRYVVFAGGHRDAETLDLYVHDLGTNRTVQVTETEHYERFPVFSPDGQSLWFSLDQGDGFKVASVQLSDALTGKAQSRVRWSPPAGDAYFVRFSHEGDALLLSHGDWGSFRIARIPIAELD